MDVQGRFCHLCLSVSISTVVCLPSTTCPRSCRKFPFFPFFPFPCLVLSPKAHLISSHVTLSKFSRVLARCHLFPSFDLLPSRDWYLLPNANAMTPSARYSEPLYIFKPQRSTRRRSITFPSQRLTLPRSSSPIGNEQAVGTSSMWGIISAFSPVSIAAFCKAGKAWTMLHLMFLSWRLCDPPGHTANSDREEHETIALSRGRGG